MRRAVRRWALLILLGALVPARAGAEPPALRQQVTLVGGAQVEGDIVELLAGSHVTLRLDSGQVRRIGWREIVSIGAVASPAEPVPWPQPDRNVPTPSEAARAQLQEVSRQLRTAFEPLRPRVLGRGLTVGAGIGMEGSGPFVLDLGFEPIRWLSFELGGGFGGSLGPLAREAIRVNLGFPGAGSVLWRISAGVAAQESLLPQSAATDPTQSYPGAPRVAARVIPFVGGDQIFFHGLGARIEFGYGVLVNQNSYKPLCQAPSYCPLTANYGGGLSGPTVLGLASRDAGPPLFFRFEALYRFDFGAPRGAPPAPSPLPESVAPVVRLLDDAKLDVTGRLESSGGTAGTWSMATERCTSAMRRGFLAAELYSRAPADDTEVVVVGGVLGGPELLVRVPGGGTMVRVRRAACARLDGEIHQSATKRGSSPGVEGTIDVDCSLPGGGRLTGSSTFTCL